MVELTPEQRAFAVARTQRKMLEWLWIEILDEDDDGEEYAQDFEERMLLAVDGELRPFGFAQAQVDAERSEIKAMWSVIRGSLAARRLPYAPTLPLVATPSLLEDDDGSPGGEPTS